MTRAKTGVCPACGKTVRVRANKGLYQHKDQAGSWCTVGSGEGLIKAIEKQMDQIEERIDVLLEDPLEVQAKEALRQVRRAWEFIWQQELPYDFEPSIRALILSGADPVTIVGAVTIAAQKRGLEMQNQWTYACGIVRNRLSLRQLEEM